MPTTQAMSAQGTFIGKGDGASPENFAEIAEVKNIGGPDEKADEIDVTHLRSPEGYREFIQSFKDGGEIPLTLNFIPSSATQDSTNGLRAEFQSGAIKNYQITYPDGTTCTFAAWVKQCGNAAQVGNALEFNVTLRMVGPTTWNEASS